MNHQEVTKLGTGKYSRANGKGVYVRTAKHREEARLRLLARKIHPSRPGGWKMLEEVKRKISQAKTGGKLSLEHKQKISVKAKHSGVGKWMTGRKISESTRQKFSDARKGSKNWNWIEDRTLLKKREDRRSSAYCEWVRRVKNRDGWKCKIVNQDCSGRMEAHHILCWTEYPELRYQISNGITLCHAHHPRKRAAELMLASMFQQLIAPKEHHA